MVILSAKLVVKIALMPCEPERSQSVLVWAISKSVDREK